MRDLSLVPTHVPLGRGGMFEIRGSPVSCFRFGIRRAFSEGPGTDASVSVHEMEKWRERLVRDTYLGGSGTLL